MPEHATPAPSTILVADDEPLARSRLLRLLGKLEWVGQIIEASDTSGLIDGLIVPLLADGGWAVATSDMSSASVAGLRRGVGVPVPDCQDPRR